MRRMLGHGPVSLKVFALSLPQSSHKPVARGKGSSEVLSFRLAPVLICTVQRGYRHKMVHCHNRLPHTPSR